MFISTSHFFPKNYLFQLFPYTSFRYYCCWKTLLLISWSSIPCLRDDKIWLGLSICSSSCGKHNPIVWNNMERVIETKIIKGKSKFIFSACEWYQIDNIWRLKLFIHRKKKKSTELAVLQISTMPICLKTGRLKKTGVQK